MLKCILATRFELCIDKGYEVRELTSQDNDYEAGTTIVMRIIFEDYAMPATIYNCRICGYKMRLETGAVDDTAGVMVPKGVSIEWSVRTLSGKHMLMCVQHRMPSTPSSVPNDDV